MKVLLDECLPRKLAKALAPHEVVTVPEVGWAGMKNGALIRLAEKRFDVFITADQNVEYQQNLSSLTLRIIVFVAPDNRLQTLLSLIPDVLDSLETIQPGDLVRVGPTIS